ncbi:winged helix-turn-helix transcriptional regulator [Candidatus Woesearchaeota archaeon]|nr:winged helix-turn-helix transcriptional regulator [Candidatus Woesearchaeota archaeon]
MKFEESENLELKKTTAEFIPIKFVVLKYGFSTVFMRNISLQKETDEKNDQKTTQKIVELIAQDPSITRNNLAKIIGITPYGIKYHLRKLAKEGKIKRIGSDKGGYWEVLR